MRRSPESLARLAAAIALAAGALLLFARARGRLVVDAGADARPRRQELSARSVLPLAVALRRASAPTYLVASSTNPTGGSGAWDGRLRG